MLLTQSRFADRRDPDPPSFLGQAHQQVLATLEAHPHSGLSNLVQETHSEIFYPNLLYLAKREELQGNDVLAGSLYQILTQTDGVTQGIKDLAEKNLGAIRGEGPWPLLVERGSRILLREITSPKLMLEMTAAGMGFRLGRLAGGLFARWKGMQSLSLWAASRGTGLVSEAGAFSGMAYALSSSVAGEASPAYGDMFRSSMVMFSSLHLARGLLGSNSMGRALAATYGGIFANHYLQQNFLHWEKQQAWSAVMRQSLSETVTFTLGARVAGLFLGRALSPMERSLDLAIGKMEGPRSPLVVEVLQEAGTGAKIPSLRWEWERLFGHRLHMKSTGEGGSSKPTGTFLNPTEAGKRSPLELTNELQFPRRIEDPELKFFERLAEGDIDFDWRVMAAIEPQIKIYLMRLNFSAKKQGFKRVRSIRFRFPDDPKLLDVVLIKSGVDQPFIRLDDGIKTPSVPSSPVAQSIARIFPRAQPPPSSRSGSHFRQAAKLLNEPPSSPTSSSTNNPPPRSEPKPRAKPPTETKTSVAPPIHTVQGLWAEVKSWLSPPKKIGEGGKAKQIKVEDVKNIFYIPETPLTQMHLNQMRTILIYIPEGNKLRIHDGTGNKTWEIRTDEYGELHFKERDLVESTEEGTE